MDYGYCSNTLQCKCCIVKALNDLEGISNRVEVTLDMFRNIELKVAVYPLFPTTVLDVAFQQELISRYLSRNIQPHSSQGRPSKTLLCVVNTTKSIGLPFSYA